MIFISILMNLRCLLFRHCTSFVTSLTASPRVLQSGHAYTKHGYGPTWSLPDGIGLLLTANTYLHYRQHEEQTPGNRPSASKVSQQARTEAGSPLTVRAVNGHIRRCSTPIAGRWPEHPGI
ncbi:hypothetical protein BDP81DRAFT_76526 [Colletotrichum phormii]|uniref:Secreted protein n=1 Tax=Colletotrichum phormii TaxID=359342 RepID=A0AAI9ZLE8_9PEZI|nr:uncharacterized protein BDP81DRAFT_76526 [Colletotrichum phormii]KAK1625720.1 hypothetical protein BDP81DRAFT_76526 [Colletotrichum phormii]